MISNKVTLLIALLFSLALSARALVPGAPQTPIDFSVTTTTETTIELFWRIPTVQPNLEIEEGFEIVYKGYPLERTTTTITYNVPCVVPLEEFSYTITGLEEMNTYSLTLKALGATRQSPATSAITGVTLKAVPYAPELAMISSESTTITVVVNPPNDTLQNGLITSYEVKYTGQRFDTTTYTESITVTDTTYPATANESYEIRGLEEYDTYTIEIRAENNAGLGYPLILTMTTQPSAPTGAPILYKVISGSNSLDVYILPPEGAMQNSLITGYKFSYTGLVLDTLTRTKYLWVADQTYPATHFEFLQITGLKEFNNYEIEISAINSEGTGIALVIEYSTTEASPTGAPLNVAVTADDPSSVTVTWEIDITSLNSNLTGFNLYYTSECEYEFVFYPVTTLGSYSYILSNLTVDQEYKVYVTVVNIIGEGPRSQTESAVTFPLVVEPVVCVLCIVTPIFVVVVLIIVGLIALGIFLVFCCFWEDDRKKDRRLRRRNDETVRMKLTKETDVKATDQSTL
ncbi:Down syndrome cell adhesion molecule-like protein Dscam2 isoform X8 [Oopsacas minuta]|uniref:Down syndrome cell adhesion molecule-like protein Dscam2 isoform X8 n=1 Tax=Oopsacas minuta TaxID=111878 RepID=A0AAV7KK60_9METZ|nr:Down syndrome cell adhesion molecule-like protein Dscam2 isoform X8 [Oopsacas minuta]